MKILENKTMAKGDKAESYYRYQAMVQWLLSLVGLWPTEKPVWSYYVRPYVLLFLNVSAFTAMLNFILHDVTNANIIIKLISLWTSASLSMLKIFMLTMNQGALLVIYKQLSSIIGRSFEEKRLVEYACKRVNRCYSLAHTLAVTVFGSFCVVLVVVPLLHSIIDQIKDPTTAKFLLIYPSRYPWDATSNRILFVITYVMEIGTLFTTCSAVSGIDGFILFLICQGVIELRAMAYRLNNIKEGESYEEVIKKCVIHYVLIANCRDELQRIYGPVLIYNIGTSAVLMCTLMYQLAGDDLPIDQVLRMIVYMCAKALQVYINTWSGTLLQEESENYLQHVYLSDWLGTKSSQSIYITLFQRPLVIRACHLLDASVEVFQKTMNTTISYFLLLRTIV